VREATGNEDVDILYGVTYDERAQDELRVILIAAGFGEKVLVTEKASAWKGVADIDIPAFLRYGDSDSPFLNRS
jgi:cell division protein FtsZ